MGSKSERAMPRPSPGLRLGSSSRHWWHAGTPGHSIEIDPVRPGYTAVLARARVRAHPSTREVHRFSESEGLGALRQIRGACRLCGTHQRHRRLVGVDQVPHMGHV